MSSQLNRQLLRLSSLLQLEKRARQAGRVELGFVMVNETAGVLPYRQAALWEGGRRGRVAALSGVSAPDPSSPYVRWLARLLAGVAGGPRGAEAHALTAADVDPATSGEWAEHLPPHAYWLPLPARDGRLQGGLLLARSEPWAEADGHLLEYVGDAFAHALALARVTRLPAPAGTGRGRRWLAAAALALLVGGGAVPVRQSVLAPAEVVPRAPVLVRAPFDGVVDRVEVDPNQPVQAGQPLAALDTNQLRTRLTVARKARDVAAAEYQQAAQQSVTDPRAKARLPALQGKLEQAAAEAAYVQSLLDRATLTAPMAGVAVFDDRNDWIGRPVSQGERILTIADPDALELQIWLPVGDAVPLADDAEVSFFLNVAPDAPAHGRLTSAAYWAQPTPDGTVAYRLKADLRDGGERGERLRIGLRGTAKIYGETAPLALWILRRPIAAVRQWLAL